MPSILRADPRLRRLLVNSRTGQLVDSQLMDHRIAQWNASLIITHDQGVERTSYVVIQFIILHYWRHLLRLTITYTLHNIPYEITNQPYPTGLLFPNHTLSYPTLPQPIPCPTFTTPTHILLYSTLPCILYTNHIYSLPYLTLHTLPQHNHTTIPTRYTLNIHNPTHTLPHHIPYPTLHLPYFI